MLDKLWENWTIDGACKDYPHFLGLLYSLCLLRTILSKNIFLVDSSV